jgi:hypothetical protein
MRPLKLSRLKIFRLKIFRHKISRLHKIFRLKIRPPGIRLLTPRLPVEAAWER